MLFVKSVSVAPIANIRPASKLKERVAKTILTSLKWKFLGLQSWLVQCPSTLARRSHQDADEIVFCHAWKLSKVY